MKVQQCFRLSCPTMKTNLAVSTASFAMSLLLLAAPGTVLLIASGASAQNLFETDASSDFNVYEFMPNGGSTTFASGLAGPEVLAFQGVTLPVPEPSALGLVAVGLIGLLRLMRRRNKV